MTLYFIRAETNCNVGTMANKGHIKGVQALVPAGSCYFLEGPWEGEHSPVLKQT